ncbi:MAG: hypothetical protein HY360_08670 [Verrucomicrobia bacterium]|nr:hypothetical protein [Verrucomicrobiota bacterium]
MPCNASPVLARASARRCAPMSVCASSDYYATRHQGVVLQQLEHPISADVSVNDCFRTVSRFFDRIQRPEQLLTALPEAMRVLTHPVETGAVTIALPQDIQTYAYDYPAHFFEERVWRIERPLPHPHRIAAAVALLKKAKRPAIIAGGGVHYSEAWTELKTFAERFGIPVGETFAGKGAMRAPSLLALGGFGVTGSPCATKILRAADLVICVGTRLTDFSTGSNSVFQHPAVQFISINVTSHDAHKLGALPILADAREALRLLNRTAQAGGVKSNRTYLDEIALAKRMWDKQVKREIGCQYPGEIMSQGQLLCILNDESRPGDTVVSAAGTPVGDLLRNVRASLWRKRNHFGGCPDPVFGGTFLRQRQPTIRSQEGFELTMNKSVRSCNGSTIERHHESMG